MFLVLLSLLLPFSTSAQEALDAIVERGHVAHWLICGPFSSDVEGGIAAALRAGDAPLGARDFLASMGGVSRARPQAGQPVQAEDGFLAWQAAGADAPNFDLAPLFPSQPDGVAYAAFYTRAATRQPVYLEFHAALGARIWVNGALLREVRAAPLSALGVTRLVVTLSPGPHLFIFEIPGATFETLTEGADISLRELGALALANRTLLTGASGFEFALRVQPAAPLGSLFVIPALEDTGAFSGTASDIRQDTQLTIFNPQDTPATPVRIAATMGMQNLPVVLETEAIPAADSLKTTLSVPVTGAVAGQSIPVTLQLSQGASQFAFNDTLVVASRAPGGRVYILSGAAHRPDAPEDQSTTMELRNQSFVRQIILRGREPDYGFDLGAASDWQAALLAYPDQRDSVLQGVALDHLGAWALHGRIDERLVNGELLVRNLALGMDAAQRALRGPRLSYVAWNLPGIAAQTPQLLAQAGIKGIVSNLAVPGLPPLFHHQALDGSRVLHRRQELPNATLGLEALRDRVRLTRRAMDVRGIHTDVLLHESATMPPEPFFFGAAVTLKAAYPSMILHGGAPAVAFDQLEFLPPNSSEKLLYSARDMTARRPGSVMAQPALKQAHAALLGRLRTAEFLATLAALWGAEYPGAALEYAWRQAIFVGAPERLGLAETPRNYLDALAAARGAADWIDGILRNAGTYAAAQVDTRAKAPVPPEGARALVVFNPTGGERSDLCSTVIEFGGASGFTLIDDTGHPVPFHADQLGRTPEGDLYTARLRFVAEAVPSLGYRCYYVLPQGPIPLLTAKSGARIENFALRVEIDHGNGVIRSLVDRRTGVEHARRGLNDLVALAQDTSRTDGGWELWSTGAVLRASESKPEIKVEATDFMQQATVSTPFAGGTLTRRYVLYEGVPRLFCETLLDGVSLEGRALLATFAPPEADRAPVHGVPFGVQVGRRSKGVLEFRSSGLDNLSGTGAQPALQWTALSPNDGISTGGHFLRALGPAALVPGEDPALKDAALSLQSALAKRGIPAALWADVPHRPDPFWEDGTEFLQFDGDLDHGTAMRIVLGHPEQNAFADALLSTLPEDVQKAFLRRFPGGASLYIEDDRSASGHAPVPTLLLAGSTPAETAVLARQIATSIVATGEIVLSRESVVEATGNAAPESGLAVLFEGTMLSSVERDGTLALGLAQGHAWREDSTETPALSPDPLAFRFALLPFSGTWRDADVPRAAQDHAQPLIAVLTDLHSGQRAPTGALLRFSAPGLLVSALKPAGLGTSTVHPRNGLLLRTWDSLGRGWSGGIEAWTRLGDARTADLSETPVTQLPVSGDRFDLTVPPGAVHATWILPTGDGALGVPARLADAADRHGAVPVRYWRHNAGAAPPGGVPVSVLLRDGVAGDSPTIEAVVANPGVESPIEGVLYLRAADGWSIDPTHIYYNLAPGTYARHAVSLLQANGPPNSRGATAHAIVNGVHYRDVLDAAPPPEVEVTRTLAQIKATVRSRSGVPLEGHADLIVSPRLWADFEGAAGYAPLSAILPVSVLPARAALAISPYATQDVLFRISDPDADLAGVLRVSVNGRTIYTALPERQSPPE